MANCKNFQIRYFAKCKRKLCKLTDFRLKLELLHEFCRQMRRISQKSQKEIKFYMADFDNAGNAGANGGADDKAGKSGNAAGDKKAGGNADDKAGDKGADKSDDDGDDDEPDKKADKKAAKYTDDDIERIVKKRLGQAEKKWNATKDMSDKERLETENAELKRGQIERDQKDEVLGILDIGRENGMKLYRYFKEDFDIDEKTNEIKNLAEIKKKAKAEFPAFFQKLKGDGDGGDKGKGDKGDKGASFNALIRKKAGRG